MFDATRNPIVHSVFDMRRSLVGSERTKNYKIDDVNEINR